MQWYLDNSAGMMMMYLEECLRMTPHTKKNPPPPQRWQTPLSAPSMMMRGNNASVSSLLSRDCVYTRGGVCKRQRDMARKQEGIGDQLWGQHKGLAEGYHEVCLGNTTMFVIWDHEVGACWDSQGCPLWRRHLNTPKKAKMTLFMLSWDEMMNRPDPNILFQVSVYLSPIMSRYFCYPRLVSAHCFCFACTSFVVDHQPCFHSLVINKCSDIA